MSPEVTAAWIAAGVGVLTVATTAVTQYFSQRATSRATQKALGKTLGEQRTRTLNERFATAAGQLGDDKPAAVRLAGVYAMAGLADDWPENRQTCVDVLCAYLRLPYERDPGEELKPKHLAFLASREVRWTVIQVIAAHLREAATVSWQGLEFDFNHVTFDGGDFRDAVFSRDSVAVFDGAEFSGGMVRFHDAKFSGGHVYFGGAKFSGGRIRFDRAEFSGGAVSFRDTELSAGTVEFGSAKFSGSTVLFHGSKFYGGTADFSLSEFSGGTVDFGGARFSGGTVDFLTAQFRGGEVDFGGANDWSSPPAFSWGSTGTPARGVKLPGRGDQSQA